MKTFISLLILVSLISCDRKKLQNDSVMATVMIDQTDTMALPTAEEIYSFVVGTTQKWASITIRIGLITDIGLNRVYVVHLPAANPLLSNPRKRDLECENFRTEALALLNKVLSSPVGKSTSRIYEPIVKELNVLKEDSSDEKLLLVFTNLCENSGYSIYNPQTYADAKFDPTKVIEHFTSVAPMSRLNNIHVFLICQPTDTLSDNRFKVMSDIYTTMLTKAGAKVTIGANL